MNTKLFTAALGLALTIGAVNANAQKTINEGIATYDTEVRGQPATAIQYFDADSGCTIVTFGAGTFKMLRNAKHDYLAVILDIPIAGLKKAGIATPAELEEGAAALPQFTFAPTTETKTISGFNCKKVVATDSKTGKTYDVWITNDIVVPSTAIPFYYATIGGFPVQFVYFQEGEEVNITIKTLTEGKAPAGTYAISSDYPKGTLSDLHP